jgi:predicted adenylyl cyclase CyaB
MSNHTYEIEIKSLLGGKEKAEELKQKMQAADPQFSEIGSHKQLNHYFVDGDLNQLYQNVGDIIEADKKDKLKELAEKATDYSVRTRWADGKVILVVKASVDDTTSSNGTARLEWESKVNKTIEELDQLLLNSGFKYQAKWSRERQEFKYKGANVSIDKNAGYGYLSEFEMVIEDPSQADQTKATIRQMMKDLGVNELPQDRLARMFDHYNKNWEEYYGTEKIFNIE